MKRILVVDDNSTILNLLDLILNVHGYDLKKAKSVDEAIDLFTNERFDLVLTDICMPGQDGNSLAGFVKLCCPKTPVVAVTSDELMVDSKKFDAVLGKPFYTKDLITLIRQILSSQCECAYPLKQVAAA